MKYTLSAMAVAIVATTGCLETTVTADNADAVDQVVGNVTFTATAVTTLAADGPDGADTYNLIEAVFGSGSIESPSLYSNNHPEEEHLWEETDSVVGDHFVFAIHLDDDWDRDKWPDIDDRQRNEIKTFGSSADELKGYYGETMRIRWQFKITDGMEVSTKFSHFFQLKAVGDDAGHPISTLTGREKSGEDVIEIRHADSSGDVYLDTALWEDATGQWLQADVIATFIDNGYYRIVITSLDGSDVILFAEHDDIDMWRSDSQDDNSNFVRPKWGIYRSIAEPDNLRSDEEIVRFANFEIFKGTVSTK